MGARDHEDGDGTDHALGSLAGQSPGDEGDRGGGGGDIEEQGGGPIRQRLGPGVRGLGVGDQALDAGQGGVVADGVDAHPHRRVGRHRSRHDPLALTAGHGEGLTRDHRLVEGGAAVVDDAVGWYPAARTHQYHVVHGEGPDGDLFHLATDDSLRGVGQ